MQRTLPAAPRQINHLAFPCFDVGATRAFYTELLGLRLTFAWQGTSEEWGGREYLMMTFALASAQQITFFALAGVERPPDDGLPKDIRHLALMIDRSDTEAWQRRLGEADVSFWTEDHDGDVSIYFADPNGLTLELTAAEDDGGDAAAASSIVQRWVALRS